MGNLMVEFKEHEIVVSEFGYPTHTFRLVDCVLPGYMIWNIGRHHMPEGYLPLCRLAFFQPFPGGRNIDAETLLAIKIDGAHTILDATWIRPGNARGDGSVHQAAQNSRARELFL